MNPMVDLGRLLAAHGANVTLITTPANAARIQPIIDRDKSSALPIHFAPLPFPSADFGLPDGCESFDCIPTGPNIMNLFKDACIKWFSQIAFQLKAQGLDNQHPASCIIADSCHGSLPRHLADSLGAVRFGFYSMCSLTLLSNHNIYNEKVYERITDEYEPFIVPNLAHAIKVTKAQAPGFFTGDRAKFGDEVRESDMSADGIVLNTFHDLEPWYIENFEKAMGTKIWAVGPLSLCNRDEVDMAARGRKATISVERCMSWLDGMEPKSVIYVSFGSLTYVKLEQVVEIGYGLLAAGFPFLWVVRGVESGSLSEAKLIAKWLVEFEEKIAERGMVVRGWAPQMLILGHQAVGGFVTHCGWNSVIEGMTAGVPMVTWPFMWDQFLNERLVVNVLGIGVGVGVKEPAKLEENRPVHGVVIGRDVVEKAVREVIKGEERRERAALIKKKAHKAMQIGGSSYENINKLIEFMMGTTN